MSTQTLLAKFFLVTAMSAPVWPHASAAEESKLSVTWRFTFSSKDARLAMKLDHVFASARAADRPVMMDFYAEWCAACRLLDRNAYTSPEVILQAKRFVTVRIDVSNGDATMGMLAKRFGVNGLPTLAFISSRGTVLGSSSIVGLVDASTLARELRKIP